MNNKIITKEFEGQEVGFRETNGILEVSLFDTAKNCGWIKTAKGKEYIRWEMVEKHLQEIGLSDVRQLKYIPEYAMYYLIGKSQSPKAIKFQIWVATDVLPSIRKHGAYISDDEENVDQDYIKFAFGQLAKTFGECSIEQLADTYKDCMDWHKKNKTRIAYKSNSKKRKDATHTINDSKIMIMEKIVKALENRNLMLCESNKFGLVSEIDGVIKDIKDNIKKQHNTSNRGKLGQKTKKINALQEQLESVCPTCD